MFGAYRRDDKGSYTKLAKLIDIPKCIEEINENRFADQEYSKSIRTTTSRSTLGNIYFNNFGFKIVNTPTALASVKNSFDFMTKARSMANQTELTQS
jgi:hypothetical protein